jgi:hypothetical protein
VLIISFASRFLSSQYLISQSAAMPSQQNSCLSFASLLQQQATKTAVYSILFRAIKFSKQNIRSRRNKQAASCSSMHVQPCSQAPLLLWPPNPASLRVRRTCCLQLASGLCKLRPTPLQQGNESSGHRAATRHQAMKEATLGML